MQSQSFNYQPPKKKTGKIIAIILLILLLIGGGGFGAYYAYANEMGPFAEKNVDASKLEVETTSVLSEDNQGVEMVTQSFKSDRYPFTITYPQLKEDPDQFNKEAFSFVKKEKQAYVDEVVNSRLKQKDASGQLTIDTQTLINKDGLMTFVMTSQPEINRSENPSHTMRWQVLRFNSETKKRLTFNEVVEQTPENLKALNDLVENALLNDTDNADKLTTTDKGFLADKDWDFYQQFTITDEGLTLYFNPDDTFNAADALTISMMDLNDFLTEEYKVVRVDPTKKLVALTFDDGPDPYGTPVVLETLEKYKAKGTFFMLGSRVKEYPDLAVRIRDEGHELGNHSWSHPLLTRISADKVAQEINSTVDIIEQTTGQKPTVFRPPYGGFNQTVVDQLKGIPVIMWEVDTNDWKYRSEARLLEEVKKQVHDRSIILMHDIHKTTADGLDAVIQYLKDEDYHFVTTTEMLDVIAYDKENKDTK